MLFALQNGTVMIENESVACGSTSDAAYFKCQNRNCYNTKHIAEC